MYQVTRTITSKGQVTIPKRIREQLGVHSADKVTFIVHDSGAVEVRPATFEWKDLRGVVPPIPGRESVDFRDFFEEAMKQRGDDLMAGRR